MNAIVAVPAGGPLFEGHFPGRPILPGIAQLVLISRALDPEGRDVPIREIPFVRFRGLVEPGDTLNLSAERREAEGLRFEARRAGALVANGAIVFGAPRHAFDDATAVASRAPRGTPSIDALIPHRPPMLFVTRVLGEADDGATCVARIPHQCALVESGATPAFVALEAAAQTAAVWEALNRARGSGPDEPKTGYLVSIKDVTLYRGTIPADVEMLASIRLLASAQPLTTYAVEVVVEGGLALAGTIGTYLSD